MNAELLAMLNGSMPPSNRHHESEPKNLLSFKAGKMIAERQPNGKYWVTPDPRRGTLEVNWTESAASSGVLKIEWKDRRTRSVVDSLTVFPEDDCTYSKVDTGPGRENDRVYLLQYGNSSERRFFFWMQEKEEGNQDEEFCIKINTFMADPEEAAAAAKGETKKKSSSATTRDDVSGESSDVQSENERRNDVNVSNRTMIDSNMLQSIMQGLGSSSGGGTATTTAQQGNHGPASSSPAQVDALSSILENLGMPRTAGSANSSSTSTGAETFTTHNAVAPAATPLASSTTGASTNRGLTLSDLQGAMAGLATTSPTSASASATPQRQPSSSGPPLSDIVTAENVVESGILQDERVKAKLISLLPENQQSEERLLENIRSPQVRQCLNALTAALCDDQGGASMENLNSILANFQLRPEDGMMGMMAGNPIQAFLDCVLKSVQREGEENEESNTQQQDDHNNNHENSVNNDNDDDDNDAEMKESS